MDLDKDISVYDNPDYHFFWGGHCSQWMVSPFEEFGETFNTAEQFMMAAKAKTFGDEETYALIMAEEDPAEQKKLGRKVKNFVRETWDDVARDYVTLANYDKFTQNDDYYDFLMEHKGCFFVEASPYDDIWGIGIGVNTAGIENPNNWKGSNWLGECINHARDMILREFENAPQDISGVARESEVLRERLNWNK